MQEYQLKSQELQYLKKRGFIKQTTQEQQLDELFLNSPNGISFYIGFDCTAKSLHVGHLIPIMIARYLVSMGHQAIIILGTTTAKIGDPSGKNQTRQILSEQEIENNFHSISNLIKKFMQSNSIQTTKSIKSVIFLENNWLENVNIVQFLREYGSHFSVNKMLAMETFKNRLENHLPLSFLEFTYSLFQAYDFVHLAQNYNCVLQIGGSDQWGNIIAGIDLGHKIHTEKHLFGLTTNLLVNSDGQKMGKTVNGAVWLDEEMLSVFDYWQYFRNIDDNDIEKILMLLSDLDTNKISELMKDKDHNINQIKIELATSITSICHGHDKAIQAAKQAQSKFSNTKNINYSELEIDFFLENLNSSQNLLEIIKIGLPESSNSQIRKLFEQNGIKINGNTVQNCLQNINLEKDFIQNKMLVEVGKKRKFIFGIK